jgi:hypothetical protein
MFMLCTAWLMCIHDVCAWFSAYQQRTTIQCPSLPPTQRQFFAQRGPSAFIVYVWFCAFTENDYSVPITSSRGRPRSSFWLRRLLDTWEYGSGSDYRWGYMYC